MDISMGGRNLINNYMHAGNHHIRFIDTVDGPNEGWLCVYSNIGVISPDRIRHTTYSLGYVFWDSQRLRDYGFPGSRYVGGFYSVF